MNVKADKGFLSSQGENVAGTGREHNERAHGDSMSSFLS